MADGDGTNAGNNNGGSTTPDPSKDQNSGGTPSGTAPITTDAGAGNGATIDTSKLNDADWEKIYSDPKLYAHSRFKTLNERANKAKELEDAQKKAEEEKMKANNEFQKLAETKEAEANTWRQKAETAQVDNQIALEAQKAGIVDLEAVTKLIDRSGIKLNEDGSITGIEASVKALIEAKPYLKGGKTGNPTTIGSATNPGDTTATTPKFKYSQIKDAKFFREHEAEIGIALKNNLIEDDRPGRVK